MQAMTISLMENPVEWDSLSFFPSGLILAKSLHAFLFCRLLPETLFLLAALGQVIKVEAVAWIPTKFQLGGTKRASTRGLLQTINPASNSDVVLLY